MNQPDGRLLTYTRLQAAKALGLSLRTIDNLLADPGSGFPAVRVGRKVLIPIRQLEQWLEAQANSQEAGENHGKHDVQQG